MTGFARRGLIRAPLQNTDFTTILWIHHQTIHVCMFCGQQFTSLLFLRLLSELCQTSMNARFVLSHLCWLFNKGYRAVRSRSDIIYRFNYFLGQFKHQWIHKTSVTTQRVFSPPLRGSHTPNQPPLCIHLWYW